MAILISNSQLGYWSVGSVWPEIFPPRSLVNPGSLLLQFFIVSIVLSVCTVKICNKKRKRKQERGESINSLVRFYKKHMLLNKCSLNWGVPKLWSIFCHRWWRPCRCPLIWFHTTELSKINAWKVASNVKRPVSKVAVKTFTANCHTIILLSPVCTTCILRQKLRLRFRVKQVKGSSGHS